MLIDGRTIAQEILASVDDEAKKMEKPPRLAAVLVGDSIESRKFLKLKKIAAEKIGIDFQLYEFLAEATTQKLRKEIVGIAKAGVNDGVIIELPLPAHINTQYILNAIPENKDPDVLSQGAQASFFVGRSKILPPAVEAVKMIIEKNAIDIEGKSCTIFGYGLLVGKPVSHWLASQNATVSVINEFTPDPESLSRDADIIITGVGRPRLVAADMVKDGAIVIDFAGDVDFESVRKKASLITPPVGGCGPIVTAAVLKNLVKLLK